MDARLERFKEKIEEEQAIRYAELYPAVDPPKVKIIPGRKYTKVDVGDSGKFMVDADGNIFGIKGYGVIHRGKRYGNLDTIDSFFWGEYAPIRRGDA